MIAFHAVNVLESLNIGGIQQWVLMRGKNVSNPVLLLIQQGPGFPIINEATAIEQHLQLEDDFIVVYWDQRACGKSFHHTISPQSMMIDQFIVDTQELIQILIQRFSVSQLYVAGFSQGGTIAALTAAVYPDSIRAVVTVGMDVQFDESECIAYNFVLEQASSMSNRQAIRELQRIGPPPHLNSQSFNTRVKWLANFGGVNRHETYNSLLQKTLWQLITSRAYSLVDIGRTLRGMQFAQEHFLPHLAGFDVMQRVPRLDVPIWMMQGRHDYAAPPAIAERYYHTLHAPAGKQLMWFDDSAHMPHYEESAKFRASLLAIKEQCESKQDLC